MAYELRPVASPEEWRAMHDIRLATLFAGERHGGRVTYNENHPHDRAPENQCFLLMLDGLPAGVVRLDTRPDGEGVLRLVAITPALQGAGHGHAMCELVEAEARRRGMNRLFLNAAEAAVGFYEKTGWHREAWDEYLGVGFADNCVQMAKVLG